MMVNSFFSVNRCFITKLELSVWASLNNLVQIYKATWWVMFANLLQFTNWKYIVLDKIANVYAGGLIFDKIS